MEATNIAMAGMDPIRFLETEDETLVLTMQAIAMNVAEIRAKMYGGKK